MLFVTESYLLNFLVRTLETADTLVIDPNTNAWFGSLLYSHQPILLRIHPHNVVSVSLQKLLLPRQGVFTYQDTPSAVVYFVILEHKVRVVQWWKGKRAVQLQERLGWKTSVVIFLFGQLLLFCYRVKFFLTCRWCLLSFCQVWWEVFLARFQTLLLSDFLLHLFRIYEVWQVDKIVAVLPLPTLYHFEGHFLRQRLPIVNVTWSVYAPNTAVRADLDSLEDMCTSEVPDGPFRK